MESSPIAPVALEGWFVLHQFFKVDRLPAEPPELDERRARAGVVQELFSGWEDLGDDGWSGLYRVVGGGTDYMAIHFRSSLQGLGQVERTLRAHPGGQDLDLTNDYVSVVELGLYHLTVGLLEKAREQGVVVPSAEWTAMLEEALEEQRSARYVQGRLYPRPSPDMPFACFYPMDKRRNVGQNWYSLPVEERARLMADHGRTGRAYAGRVSQVISGSVGLDDWEWSVTLFAADPLVFKALVTEMRYDEVSAVYAEFGSFWVGHRIDVGHIADELSGAP